MAAKKFRVAFRLWLHGVFLLSLCPGAVADNAVETVLHSFDRNIAVYKPFTGEDGNLYGRTRTGGANGRGVFYRLSAGGDYTELYQYAASEGKGSIIQGADGNFYGVDVTGGASQNGSIYRLTATGVRTTVFDFGDGSKGKSPRSIQQTGNGDFYGTFTADASDTSDASGDVYRLTPGGGLTTVYRAIDHGGSYANALSLGGDGNLYGYPTIFADGDSGALIRIVPGGSADVFYHFTHTDGSGVNADGSHPNGIVVGRDGVLYGTTSAGGANGNGTFFRVSPDGTLGVVRAFDAFPAGFGSEGTTSYFNFSLSFQGLDGNFRGTVGILFEGIVAQSFTGLFQITPDGTLLAPFGPAREQILVPGQLADGSFYYLNFRNDTANSNEIVRLAESDKSLFFNHEFALGKGIYSLSIYRGSYDSGTAFGYYAYLSDPRFVYHFDLGFEYVADAGSGGIYLYDFASDTFFYTGEYFPFPYLYDFSLNAFLYYYPDANNPGHYTSKPRYFYNFATGQIITK